MLEYDDPELRSWLAGLDADPRVDWVDAQRDRLATAWESRTIPEPLAAALGFDPIAEPIVSRSTRSRRDRRLVIAAAAVVLAIVALVVVVTRQGIDRRNVQTPQRPVPTTVPDLSKTHAIAVTPSTGLRDRQIVRVSGGFVPSPDAEQYIDVRICRAGVTPPTADTDCDGTTGPNTNGLQLSTGPFRRYPFMVRRTITVGGQTSRARPLDCAAAPGCVLYATRGGGRLKGPIRYRREKWGVAPLAFDPAAAPLPGPSVTLTPAGALRDGDTVTVRGRHFRPLYWTGVTVCVSGTEVCDGVGIKSNFRVDANGSFSVTHSPWSVFAAADGTPQDCHVVTCVVRVETSENVDVPLSFAPADTAAYPQLTLDPGAPYTDGQQVTVTVQGWPGSVGHRPGLEIEKLALRVCARGGVFGNQCGDNAVLQGPDADGQYTTTLTMHRSLTEDPGGAQIGCTQPGNCRVALVLAPAPSFGMLPAAVVILGADVVVN